MSDFGLLGAGELPKIHTQLIAGSGQRGSWPYSVAGLTATTNS